MAAPLRQQPRATFHNPPMFDKVTWEEALAAYSKAISIKPDYAEAWSNCAHDLEKWNRLDQLEIWLNKAFSSFEKVPADLLFMKSKLVWRKKNYDETLCLIEEIKFEDISAIWKHDFLTLFQLYNLLSD